MFTQHLLCVICSAGHKGVNKARKFSRKVDNRQPNWQTGQVSSCCGEGHGGNELGGLWSGGESSSFSWDHQEPSLPSPASMLPWLPVVRIKFTFPVAQVPSASLTSPLPYLLELSSWRSCMDGFSPGSNLTSHLLTDWYSGGVGELLHTGADTPFLPKL